MHFTYDISVGQVILTVPLGFITVALFKIFRILLLFRMEHEVLMEDWASRQSPQKKLSELPTRRKFWW